MPEPRIVISGAGVVSSAGIDCPAFFRSFLDNRSSICSLSERTDGGPRLELDRTAGQLADGSDCGGRDFSEGAKGTAEQIELLNRLSVGAPIIEFDAKQYVKPRKAMKVMCREIQTTFAASMLAVENADLAEVLPASKEGVVQPDQIGTVFGSEMLYGPPLEVMEAFQKCLDGDGNVDLALFGQEAMRSITPLWMLKYLPNMPTCHVGIAINARGPNNSIVLGDTSGPAAMIEAAACIRRGGAKWMLCGATGTRLSTTRLNYRNDLPVAEIADPVSQSSRPHDPNSTGIVGGEGAVTFVLESLETATNRGAKPLAEIVASAARFVPSGGMLSARRTDKNYPAGIRGSSQAMVLAIQAAMASAKLSADQVGMIVSHAMGDPVIDYQERIAILETLPKVPIIAPIRILGHSGAASGSMELLVGALALAEGMIPPSMMLRDTTSVPVEVVQPTRLTKDHVVCISHNAEGNAVAIVLRRCVKSRDPYRQ